MAGDEIKLGNDIEAGKLLAHAQAIDDRFLAPDDIRRQPHLDALAAWYLHQGRSRESERVILREIRILRRQSSPNSYLIGSKIRALAHARNARGEYREAQTLYKQAILMMGGENRKDLGIARALNGLAVSYAKQRDYRDAISAMSKALPVYENILGSNHPQTVVARNNLAEMMKEANPRH